MSETNTNFNKENENISLDIKENIFNNKEDINLENSFDFKLLLNTFTRRKKLFFISYLVIFFIYLLNVGYQRFFNPIYKGSFILLISDPMNSSFNSGVDGFSESNNKFENIAINASKNDLPTLIQYLKSPFLYNLLQEKYNFLIHNFLKFEIEVGGSRYKSAKGILKLNY